MFSSSYLDTSRCCVSSQKNALDMRTYFVAPNFDVHPPPDGPIKLGQIISAPDEPTLDPINRRDQIAAPDIFPPSIKKGFSSTSQKLLSGGLGLWAQVAASIGLNISLGFDGSEDVEITIEELETSYFNPSPEYVERVVALPEVQQYVTTSDFKVPVYMVTGMKIARGASIKTGTEHSFQGTAAVEVPGDAIRLGPEARFARSKTAQECFADSSDFVLAFRVQRIRFKKVDGEHRVRDARTYTKGAKMLGDTVHLSSPTHRLSDLEEDVIASSGIDKNANEYFDHWKVVGDPSGSVDDDGVVCSALYLDQF